MGLIRMHLRNTVHFVTNRVEHEMFLLKPTETVNHLICFWLAKAKAKFGDGIELYGFIVLSNHFHLLLNDTKGQLAEFMGYFQGNLARSVNAHLGRKGKFWAREYDDVIVEGEQEFWNRYCYVNGNAVKSGLVALPEHWRGVSSYPYIMENRTIKVTGINKAKFNDAKRHNPHVDPRDFEETYEFRLTRPPAWSNWSHARCRDTTKELLRGACREYRKKRMYRPVLGMRKVMRQSPFDRPKETARSPRFKFFCMDKGRLKELKDAYKTFVGCYRQCLSHLFQGLKSQRVLATPIVWPEGSYPPTRHRPISCC